MLISAKMETKFTVQLPLSREVTNEGQLQTLLRMFIHYLNLKRVETCYLLDIGKAQAGFYGLEKYPNEVL